MNFSRDVEMLFKVIANLHKFQEIPASVLYQVMVEYYGILFAGHNEYESKYYYYKWMIMDIISGKNRRTLFQWAASMDIRDMECCLSRVNTS